jgi:hypothetical protein
VEVQLGLAQRHSRAIVGARIWRDGDATPRYTTWLNGMTQVRRLHSNRRPGASRHHQAERPAKRARLACRSSSTISSCGR